MKLTLTFDNGPDPVTTPAVLEALAERRMPAWFFMVGNQLRRPGGQEMGAQVAAAGHHLGNHSMTHTVPLGELDAAQAEAEIHDAARLLAEVAGPGESERWFRPFGGGGYLGPHLFNQAAVDVLMRESYSVALWNSVPRDWEDPTGWVETALADIGAQAWTVLVLHDLPTGAMDQLPPFLDAATARGVEVVADLPDGCVPIRRGRLEQPLDGLVTSVER